MNKKSEVINDCFAAGEKKCECLDLEMRECMGRECAFYKTKKQAAQGRIKAARRISKLPQEKQRKIWDKYLK
jgi:hypothetical protein